MLPKMDKQSWTAIFIALALTVYQIVRLIVFANVYGGVQEDSGWFSSIARSLAERGTYTTMTSTIIDPTVSSGLNIHGRFDVQDEEGRIWFFTDNSTGPGSIVPNAVILKLFGTNFWSLKAGALLFLTLFLLLISFLLYYVGGIMSILLFHLFLLFYPHLLIPIGHEPYGEVPTIIYILLAYLLFVKATQAQSRQTLWFFLCGLAAGLTLVTKIIGLFPILSLFALWLLQYLRQVYKLNKAAPEDAVPAISRQLTLKHLLALGIGLMTLPILWEFVHLITLSRVAGFEAYQLHTAARYVLVRDDSRTDGDTPLGSSHAEFTLAKFLIVSQISHPSLVVSVIVFILILVSGPWLAFYYRERPGIQNLILLIWLGWLIHTAWFVILNRVAWVRHDWYALIFAIMLLCWLAGHFWQRVKAKPEWRTLSASGILAVIMLLSFFSQRHAIGLFIPPSLVETWRLNYLSNDTLVAKYEQQMPWILIPRDQQEEVIDYLTQLPPTSQIFYADKLQVTELAVIVGRVFYPLERRLLMPHSREDVVVIGSRVFSPWRRPQELVEPIKRDIKSQCPQVLLENDYYIICSVSK
jgi:hypothetical protein